MTDIVMLNVQKWVYERGNYQIIIENAWNASMYSQERITVNGEYIRNSIAVRQSILFWRTVFEDTVIDDRGELPLKVQWKSGLLTTKSRLLIEEERQDWTHYFNKKWMGFKGEWPEEAEYET